MDEKHVFVLDTETDRMNKGHPVFRNAQGMKELAWVVCLPDGKQLAKRNFFFVSGDEDQTQKNKITLGEPDKKHVDPHVALLALHDDLLRAAGATFVAHNAKFDRDVVLFAVHDKQTLLEDKQRAFLNACLKKDFFCTMKTSMAFCRLEPKVTKNGIRYKPPKLHQLYEAVQAAQKARVLSRKSVISLEDPASVMPAIKYKELHGAAYDAEVLCLCYFEGQKLKAFG
jgi:hypothetical protein